MSYALDLAPEARPTLSTMPVEVQELTLDRLDEVASQAAREARPVSPDEELVSDFVHPSGNVRHYVFILYVIDSAARTIRVRSIGYVTQTI